MEAKENQMAWGLTVTGAVGASVMASFAKNIPPISTMSPIIMAPMLSIFTGRDAKREEKLNEPINKTLIAVRSVIESASEWKPSALKDWLYNSQPPPILAAAMPRFAMRPRDVIHKC